MQCYVLALLVRRVKSILRLKCRVTRHILLQGSEVFYAAMANSEIWWTVKLEANSPKQGAEYKRRSFRGHCGAVDPSLLLTKWAEMEEALAFWRTIVFTLSNLWCSASLVVVYLKSRSSLYCGELRIMSLLRWRGLSSLGKRQWNEWFDRTSRVELLDARCFWHSGRLEVLFE